MTNHFLAPVWAVAVCSLLWTSSVRIIGAEPDVLLQRFSQTWNEQDWVQPRGPERRGYMRRTGDTQWRTRMLALQGLIQLGDEAVPVLLKTLRSDSVSQRILAAQALSYLAPSVPIEPLVQAAGHDPNEAVRLYAVDAIGMKGAANEKVDWSTLQQNEKNRDVTKHIGYAKLRGDQAIDPAIVSALRGWDASAIDSAIVGQTAPDFELASATDETIRLSQYRGKKSVVLVFIYGDT